MFRPTAQQFSTPIEIRHRVSTDVNGEQEISYPQLEPPLIVACAWKSKGGTENMQSGSLVVEDTAEVTTWYMPGIGQQDIVILNDDTYEIINIENVEMRNQYLILKVKRSINA